jgi:hypothetical protein
MRLVAVLAGSSAAQILGPRKRMDGMKIMKTDFIDIASPPHL